MEEIKMKNNLRIIKGIGLILLLSALVGAATADSESKHTSTVSIDQTTPEVTNNIEGVSDESNVFVISTISGDHASINTNVDEIKTIDTKPVDVAATDSNVMPNINDVRFGELTLGEFCVAYVDWILSGLDSEKPLLVMDLPGIQPI